MPSFLHERGRRIWQVQLSHARKVAYSDQGSLGLVCPSMSPDLDMGQAGPGSISLHLPLSVTSTQGQGG